MSNDNPLENLQGFSGDQSDNDPVEVLFPLAADYVDVFTSTSIEPGQNVVEDKGGLGTLFDHNSQVRSVFRNLLNRS